MLLTPPYSRLRRLAVLWAAIAFGGLHAHAAFGAAERPNIIVIVPDDHRWDATGFMQERMADLGRIARFPWFAGMTPGLDRLSREGIHFDNAFVTFSLCSPSRATMLTGRHAHLAGVVDNATYFPVNSVTYATLLRDSGYATGYFGKWHMHDQLARPGFDTVATFLNQGNYYGNNFYVNGSQVWEDGWVDDVSTEYLLQFISQRSQGDSPFLAFLGFKTPHDNRTPATRHATLFSTDAPASAPNLSVKPPYRPDANAGTNLNDNRNYFRCLKGADENVVRVLDRLDALGIAERTVVIYISDNGYYLGEHGLGDKRSAYEESMRIPMMIRYPALQSGPRIATEMALNLDLAPTILELAGVAIPDWMQGRSLVPLIAGQSPQDWPQSFLFNYARDPAYPTATPALLAWRNMDGEKLVHYPFSQAWTELFDTAADPYEITNLAAVPTEAGRMARMLEGLNQAANASGFLRALGVRQIGESRVMDLMAGNRFNYSLQVSTDLISWSEASSFRGTGQPVAVPLPASLDPSPDSITVLGHPLDHALAEGSPPTAVSSESVTLRVGANTGGIPGGRNTVLIFALPPLPAGVALESATLQVTAWRDSTLLFNADLWALGIKSDTTPILRYLEAPDGDAVSVKLQSGLLTPALGGAATAVQSAPASGLTAYLQSFYASQPTYTGGQYLFLRLNPDVDAGVTNHNFTVYSADRATEAQRPQLILGLSGASPEEGSLDTLFYRVRFADPGHP
jgi:N-acetylglucosamine-6-sulfatase